MNKISLTSLGLVAGLVGMAIPGAGFTTRWLVQEKLKKSKSYCEAVECLTSNQEAKKLLGEPIEPGRIDVGDNDACGRKDNVKWFTIPVKGSITTGKVRYWIIITDAEKNEFYVPKIELRVDDKNETSIIIKNLHDTKNINE